MNVLYKETQRFLKPWMNVLVAVVAVAGVAFLISQVTQGMWKDVIGSVVLLGVLALFRSLKLVSIVKPDGLFVRFFPFHWSRKRIPLEDVIEVVSKTYSPIREYGGWGIRCGKDGGRAYNVSGNQGVLLKYRDGKSLLIGTQKPQELEAAIRTIWRGD